MLQNAYLVAKIRFDTAENEFEKSDVSWPMSVNASPLGAYGGAEDLAAMSLGEEGLLGGQEAVGAVSRVGEIREIFG